MKEAIQKAVEGGWNMQTAYVTVEQIQHPDGIEEKAQLSTHKALLDPLFWQSLGKACGWTVKLVQHGNWDDMETITTEAEQRWKYEWHSFIDHLAEGKDAESFFASLLPAN